MLSKLYSNAFKQITSQSYKSFSVRRTFFDYINRDDTSDSNYIAATWCPKTPLQGHESKTRVQAKSQYEATRLDNGITVVTESASFPGQVDMGILLKVGTRDECSETSGALHSIQNTYLKTIMNTNETINYGIVQMSGGNFEMDYDQETSYFRANCLAHDAVDVFKMVSDCALEPRSVLAAQVGISKNEESHKMDAFLKTGEDFNNRVFQTAFGLKGVGLPLKGLKGNVSNLTSYNLQKFQLENITPNRIYVCGAGIESHGEFVDLVRENLGHIAPTTGKDVKERAATEYVGGEVRNLTEDSTLHIGAFFQGVPFTSPEYHAFVLARVVLQRRLNRLLQKYHFLDSAKAYEFYFSDSGLFGLRISGAASNYKEIQENVVSQFKKLAEPIPEEKLGYAKSELKASVSQVLERQTDRLEEAVKNFANFGKVIHNEYNATIDSITGDQINKAVSSILGSTPTFIASGGNANRLPSFDQIRNSFK